jgi:hypothetical protein|tara:strand:- start:80 stop:298 length:219 start_codon:yes stop_codon:yes gene_type:complete
MSLSSRQQFPIQGDVAIACSTGTLGVSFFIGRNQFLGIPQANIAAKPGIEFSKKFGFVAGFIPDQPLPYPFI